MTTAEASARVLQKEAPTSMVSRLSRRYCAERRGAEVPDKKIVFIAFAMEDEAQRNLLKGQSLNTRCPFEFIDMSVKDSVRHRVEGPCPDRHPALGRRDRPREQELAHVQRSEVGDPVRGGGGQADPWHLGLHGRPHGPRRRSHGALDWTTSPRSSTVCEASMRTKALVVGIDYYEQVSGLHGGVNDAYASRPCSNATATAPSTSAAKLLVGTGRDTVVVRAQGQVAQSLCRDETALLYFAGHGYIDSTGGFLCASDCAGARWPVAHRRHDVRQPFAGQEQGHHPGQLPQRHRRGQRPRTRGGSRINEGVTLLTASTAEQYSMERRGGVFTTLLVDALSGAAANLVGQITPGSVYAHIDQSLGPWAQRPVFKTNVKTFVSLRGRWSPRSPSPTCGG